MVHREGDEAVMEGGSRLPPLCVRCGAVATVFRTAHVSYTHPLALLTLLAGPLGSLVGSSLTAHYPIGYGLCGKHRLTRFWRVIQAGLTMLGGGYVFFSIAYSEDHARSTVHTWLLWAAVAAMFGGGLAMPLVGRPLSARVRAPQAGARAQTPTRDPRRPAHDSRVERQVMR